MASGDIRKWFLKQPAKSTPAATSRVAKLVSEKSLTPSQDTNKDGQKNGTEGKYKSTSKFFSSSSPTTQASSGKDDTKATVAKANAASSKRFKVGVNADSNDDEFEKPLPKKARNDEIGEKTPVAGRGRGKGRGESDGKGTQDMDIDASPAKLPAVGRGAGRGKGKADSNANDMDVDASPAKTPSGGRGRGRGRGRGDASVAATSTEDAPEPPSKKPAPAGRGRGGGGGRGGGYGFGQREAPPHKGEKEVPEGAEDALAGLTFVISGTLDSLEREEAEHLIKTHGGRITGSVSKKTDYLLADEDVGGRKSQKAKELGVKFLTEDGLFDMIRKTKPKQAAASSQPPVTTVAVKAVEVVKTPKSKADNVEKGKGKTGNGTSASVDNGKSHAAESDSWPQKHRPQSLNDIIGNQSIVNQVKDWLLQWEKHHGSSVNGKKGASSNTQKKAVLLSGQPGIGKTTTARLVCQLLGFEALEVNASDSRGKSDSNVKTGMGGKTSNTIKEMISNKSLDFGNKSDRKSVLIMDEVDGMSGGDRGGVADLIASIKSSHIPIICICNDKYSQKLKSLINYCLPLAYRKPTKQQMAKRLKEIATKEGLEVDDLALEELSERVNGDMRMALNQLQYMSLRSRTLKYADVRTRLMASAKDEDVTPFSAVDKLLGFDGGRLRMDQRMDAAMSDMDLVPLLIQENYLNYCPSGGGRDDNGTARMDAIARTAMSIAEGDIVNVQIRRYRQWQHAQMGAFMSSIIPAAYVHGRREVLVQGERNFNRFGGWLGKNSTFGKKRRLLEDVHVHLLASRICEPTREAVRLDYLPLLSMHLTQPLHNLPKDEAVQQVVDVLEEYSLDQEDMDTIVGISTLKGGEGLLDGVPGATKAALTKTYKQRLGDRRVRSADLLPVLSLPGSKKVSKRPARMNFMPAEDEENLEAREDSTEAGDEEEGNEEEDEDLEQKALALLSESRPGMTLTLDTAKTKPGKGNGRGRGRGGGSSQPKTPKVSSASKRKK